jgi:two-component system, LytTR family, response regulator
MKLKVIIIDDEKPARKELEYLLGKYEGVEILASCSNADEGMEAIGRLTPDLIFLDINMPGKNGFELLEQLDSPPYVIFVTAYDQFAIQAFEANAFDYLLKPVIPERLHKTLFALRQEIEKEHAANNAFGRLTKDSKIFIKDGEKCWLVKLSQVYFIESVGNYTKWHFNDARPMLHRTLNYLDEKLPADIFFRANRGEIINLDFIAKISTYFKGGMLAELNTGHKVEISQRQAVKFRERLSI